jgi:hypothetical protein
MRFQISDCDFGIKVGGVDYSFEHVDSVTIEDPERNKLTRGANAGNKIGLRYKEGIKEPKKWTVPILNMSQALKSVLDSVYDKGDRVDVYCIDRNDGSSKMAKNAILCNRPQQLTLDESPDALKVSLEFESFDSSEVHKS